MASPEHVGQQFRNTMTPADNYGSWFTIPHPERDSEPGKSADFEDPFGGGNGAFG